MKEINLAKYQKKLKLKLDSERYEHTIGVMYTAGALAMRYGYDVTQAMLAGLMHDCAKCISNEKKLQMCKKNNISINDIEKANPFLLHAKLGAFLAMDKYGIRDKNIISAILYHTTGKPEMNLLEKIVYIADYIEPRRNKAPNLDKIRQIAFTDIDLAMYEILNDTLGYLSKGVKNIDPMTQKAYDYYKELCADRIIKEED